MRAARIIVIPLLLVSATLQATHSDDHHHVQRAVTDDAEIGFESFIPSPSCLESADRAAQATSSPIGACRGDSFRIIDEWGIESQRGAIFEGDLDRDGNREIIFSDRGRYAYVYEAVGNDSFDLAYTFPCPDNPAFEGMKSGGPEIMCEGSRPDNPLTTATQLREVGDTDSDGLMEMIFGSGTSGVARDLIIIEQSDSTGYPDTEVARIPEDNISVNYMQITDLDEDGWMEILGTTGGTNEVSIAIWEYKGDGEYVQVYTNDFGFPSFVAGEPSVGDFDRDGHQEVALPVNHYPGYRLFVIENTGDDSYEVTCHQDIDLENVRWSSPGPDLDRDGRGDFIVTGFSGMGDADWSYLMYEADGDNSYRVVWRFDATGFFSHGGAATGDVDGDLKNELLLQNGSDTYLFRPDGDNSMELIWEIPVGCYGEGGLRIITHDVDEDRRGEVAFYPFDTQLLRVYEQVSAPVPAAILLTPDNYRLQPGDDITFHTTVQSNRRTPLSLKAGVSVSLPSGEPLLVIPPVQLHLNPMQRIERTTVGRIPEGAPAGEYRFRAFLRAPDTGLIDTDSFTVMVGQ